MTQYGEYGKKECSGYCPRVAIAIGFGLASHLIIYIIDKQCKTNAKDCTYEDVGRVVYSKVHSRIT